VKRIVFSAPARADIRRLDRDTAMRILSALHRLADTGQGDVKRLKGSSEELRLRVGNYRVRFQDLGDSIVVLAVKHRREAYR
jgi:mRNA interferase RelE/StbE